MRGIADGILRRFEAEGHRWTRDGAKAAVSPNGDTRIRLGILVAHVDRWEEGKGWTPIDAPYPVRLELGNLLENWLTAKLQGSPDRH
jgi:hypothetical protein